MDEVDRLFQGEFAWRGEDDVLIAARGTDVGELFSTGDIDDEVVIARILADDHPFVDFITGTDKKAAALLNAEASISSDFAKAIGDENAIGPSWNFSFVRAVAVAKIGGEDSEAACDGAGSYCDSPSNRAWG